MTEIIDMPNFAATEMQTKQLINREIKIEHEKQPALLLPYFCEWCKSQIKDCYYKCKKHKTIFCENCVKCDGRGEVKLAEMPTCNTLMLTECIYERFTE